MSVWTRICSGSPPDAPPQPDVDSNEMRFLPFYLKIQNHVSSCWRWQNSRCCSSSQQQSVKSSPQSVSERRPVTDLSVPWQLQERTSAWAPWFCGWSRTFRRSLCTTRPSRPGSSSGPSPSASSGPPRSGPAVCLQEDRKVSNEEEGFVFSDQTWLRPPETHRIAARRSDCPSSSASRRSSPRERGSWAVWTPRWRSWWPRRSSLRCNNTEMQREEADLRSSMSLKHLVETLQSSSQRLVFYLQLINIIIKKLQQLRNRTLKAGRSSCSELNGSVWQQFSDVGLKHSQSGYLSPWRRRSSSAAPSRCWRC